MLLAVTVVEFIIAFTLAAGTSKVVLFIVLTIVKAFYILGEFMHLSHETKALVRSLLIPLPLIFLLIFILLYESAVMDVLF